MLCLRVFGGQYCLEELYGDLIRCIIIDVNCASVIIQ